jgi:hypothetical protein
MTEPGVNPVQKAESAIAKHASDASELSESSATKPHENLSAEEQMAQFEEELKNTDWGHQPC